MIVWYCCFLLFVCFFSNWTVWRQEVAEFRLGLCCAEEERGETPGREGSPSDLVESELDPGGDSKSGEDKAFGRSTWLYSKMCRFTQTSWQFRISVLSSVLFLLLTEQLWLQGKLYSKWTKYLKGQVFLMWCFYILNVKLLQNSSFMKNTANIHWYTSSSISSKTTWEYADWVMNVAFQLWKKKLFLGIMPVCLFLFYCLFQERRLFCWCRHWTLWPLQRRN